MTYGNFAALAQKNFKRMLAYSSIAHAGYLLVAFTAFPFDGISAACLYTATYAAMNVGAFAVLTQVSGYNERARTIDDYTGLAQRHPVLASLLAFFLLSLIGIPFTGGFFGKFYVFSAAIHGGNVWLAVIGLLNSGVACFYYLRLLAAIYTRAGAGSTAIDDLRHVPVPAAIGLALAAGATLILGILPNGAVAFAEYASHSTLIEQGRQACASSPDSCNIQLNFDK
jgi:NADH-quinone oxidoreductase subunit N